MYLIYLHIKHINELRKVHNISLLTIVKEFFYIIVKLHPFAKEKHTFNIYPTLYSILFNSYYLPPTLSGYKPQIILLSITLSKQSSHTFPHPAILGATHCYLNCAVKLILL